MRRALLLSCALLLAGCASLETVAPPVGTLAARGNNTATLESGRRIYLENCTGCHAPEAVRKYSAARWPGIIADMGERAHLTAAQHRAVLAYVLAAANAQ